MSISQCNLRTGVHWAMNVGLFKSNSVLIQGLSLAYGQRLLLSKESKLNLNLLCNNSDTHQDHPYCGLKHTTLKTVLYWWSLVWMENHHYDSNIYSNLGTFFYYCLEVVLILTIGKTHHVKLWSYRMYWTVLTTLSPSKAFIVKWISKVFGIGSIL
jgi:hypothetical protein